MLHGRQRSSESGDQGGERGEYGRLAGKGDLTSPGGSRRLGVDKVLGKDTYRPPAQLRTQDRSDSFELVGTAGREPV